MFITVKSSWQNEDETFGNIEWDCVKPHWINCIKQATRTLMQNNVLMWEILLPIKVFISIPKAHRGEKYAKVKIMLSVTIRCHTVWLVTAVVHRTAWALTDTPTPCHCCNDSWHYAKCHVHPKLGTWCSFINAKSTKPSRVQFYSCRLSSTELYLLEYKCYGYTNNVNIHQKCFQYHYDYYFRLYARLMTNTTSKEKESGIHLFKFAWETSVSALSFLYAVSNVNPSLHWCRSGLLW